jgi:hypothetical protein
MENAHTLKNKPTVIIIVHACCFGKNDLPKSQEAAAVILGQPNERRKTRFEI